jgi:response regulator RpfG family c-di-GMP phosphodiesterase
MSYKLLLVDDETANLRLLERLFRQDYVCLTAPSGEEAMRLLDQHDVAVIISDQRMPQMTGLELLKQSADRRPHMVRILLTGYTDLEALVEAVNCGLVYMYVSKPWNNDDLKLRVSRAVQHYENNKLQHSLAANNERLSARIKEMRLDLVRALARLLQLRDPYLYSHAGRVNQYAAGLGKRMDLSDEFLSDLMAASFLHDLGALGAGSEIHRSFPRDVNASVVKTHAPDAVEIVACVAELRDIADVIRYHYENFDGSGGPLGLFGEEIPLASRILRVAKSFDLLTRPKHEEHALSHECAMERLRAGAGKEYDAVVVQTLSDLTTELTIPIGVGSLELQQPRTT